MNGSHPLRRKTGVCGLYSGESWASNVGLVKLTGDARQAQ